MTNRSAQLRQSPIEVLFLVGSLLLLTGFKSFFGGGPINKVKNQYLDDEESIKLGYLLDNRAICAQTEWSTEKDKFNRDQVRYRCIMKGSSAYTDQLRKDAYDWAVADYEGIKRQLNEQLAYQEESLGWRVEKDQQKRARLEQALAELTADNALSLYLEAHNSRGNFYQSEGGLSGFVYDEISKYATAELYAIFSEEIERPMEMQSYSIENGFDAMREEMAKADALYKERIAKERADITQRLYPHLRGALERALQDYPTEPISSCKELAAQRYDECKEYTKITLQLAELERSFATAEERINARYPYGEIVEVVEWVLNDAGVPFFERGELYHFMPNEQKGLLRYNEQSFYLWSLQNFENSDLRQYIHNYSYALFNEWLMQELLEQL